MRTPAQKANAARARLISRAGGQKRAFTLEQVKAIRAELERRGRVRDLALFSVHVDTLLRSCDLLSLRVETVYDDLAGEVRTECSVRQMKTKHRVVVMLSEPTRAALLAYIRQYNKTAGDYLWTDIRGGRWPDVHMRRPSYAQLIKKWCRFIGITSTRMYSTHSLRRTRAAYIYAETKDLEAVRQILGHKGLGATSAYLGIDNAAALSVARRYEM